MFFMGVVNAFFVALSVPLSMFVAFVFLPAAELITGSAATLNFIVLFALLFGLGIIVDDAIVVIENTHRIFTLGKGKLNATVSAQMAAGEVFIPVLAGTLTTLAPFFPLLFWPGIIGKFMIYLPTMLIFTLTASLIVAFIMNPVFAVDFMSHEEGELKEKPAAIFRKRGFWVLVAVAVLFDLVGFSVTKDPNPEANNMWFFWGNLLLLIALLFVLNRFVLDKVIHRFQNSVLPWIMGHYESGLRWALRGWRPSWLFIGTVALFFISLLLFVGSVSSGRNAVVFFPAADPNQVYVYAKLPVGTSVEYTDSITRQLESKVYSVLGMQDGRLNPVVESVVTNVAKGAADPMSGDQSTRSELSRIQVSFVDFEKRDGVNTNRYLNSIRKVIKGIPGAEITVSQEQNGPPTDPPVNIEIASEDFDHLIKTATALKNYLDSVQVPGVEELKMNVDLTNPEITLTVDRQRASIEGVSSAQIGQEIRTALFGREISKIKEGKDEYKIQLRNNELQRHNLVELLNMPIYFRDMATGGFKSIPISNLVKVDLTSTLGSVKRKNQKRQITLISNVLNGYTPTGVNQVITQHLSNFKEKPDDVTILQTGEGEQQAETVAFLGKAFFIAFGLILFVLVLQFNSISKSVIILSEIIFSIIGVFLGYLFTGMTVSGIMTGLGIVGLAGIVIKNGILVIEFTEELRARGFRTREAVIQAGKTRIIPVLLTALAVILGLIPLAIGFNINFITMFSDLNPHIFLGGDNAAFWKPLSWTIIFGVMFAFFMTLFIVPSMYLIAERLKRPMRQMYGGKWISFMGIPPLTVVFLLLLVPATLIKHSVQVSRRRMRLSAKTTNERFYGSWF